MLGRKRIDQVDSYKYIGLDFKGNMSLNLFKGRLAEKAKKTMGISWTMGIRSGFLSVKAAIKIWQILVRPRLEYGCQIWGGTPWRKAELIQRNMGRRILGARTNPNNEVVYGELGWWPLTARRGMLRLRYWQKLLSMDATRLTRILYS